MKDGFTFIELLIVLVIVMTLTAWLLPKYFSTVQEEHKAQVSALEQTRALQGVLNNRGAVQQQQLEQLEGTIRSLSNKRMPTSKPTK